MNNVERKLIISGCGNCPFVKYEMSDYVDDRHICSKFNIHLDNPYNQEETHAKCMLPINIKSENFIK